MRRIRMCRAKLFRSNAVIGVMAVVDPEVDGSVGDSDGQLHGDDFACDCGLERRLLQKFEVERLGFEGIDLAACLRRARQNDGCVANVGADIQDISLADYGGMGTQQIAQIVFNVAFVEEVGRLEQATAEGSLKKTGTLDQRV